MRFEILRRNLGGFQIERENLRCFPGFAAAIAIG